MSYSLSSYYLHLFLKWVFGTINEFKRKSFQLQSCRYGRVLLIVSPSEVFKKFEFQMWKIQMQFSLEPAGLPHKQMNLRFAFSMTSPRRLHYWAFGRNVVGLIPSSTLVATTQQTQLVWSPQDYKPPEYNNSAHKHRVVRVCAKPHWTLGLNLEQMHLSVI